MKTRQLSSDAILIWGNDPQTALEQLKDMKEILEAALKDAQKGIDVVGGEMEPMNESEALKYIAHCYSLEIEDFPLIGIGE